MWLAFDLVASGLDTGEIALSGTGDYLIILLFVG